MIFFRINTVMIEPPKVYLYLCIYFIFGEKQTHTERDTERSEHRENIERERERQSEREREREREAQASFRRRHLLAFLVFASSFVSLTLGKRSSKVELSGDMESRPRFGIYRK